LGLAAVVVAWAHAADDARQLSIAPMPSVTLAASVAELVKGKPAPRSALSSALFVFSLLVDR